MPSSIVDGKTSIYYELNGKGQEFLIFVSGTGFNSQVWKPFQVPFFENHYKVLISDHRGVGNSDKPDSPYSTRLFAEDIVHLMDALSIESAHFVGHSMGGRVAQWLALDNPKRVKSLVLGATGSGNFQNKADYVRGIPLDTALEIAEQGYENYMRSHVESDFFFTPDFRQRNPTDYKIAVESHLANLTELKPYLRHVIARQMHETTSRVHEINSRTLVLVGDSDKAVHGTGNHFEASLYLVNKISGASLATIPGARHAFFWEKPAESNEIVFRFLGGT